MSDFSGRAGVAVAGDGTVFVVDSGHHRMQRRSADGKFLGAWGRLGGAAGKLRDPWGIAVRGERVYVADRGNHRVQVFGAGPNHYNLVGDGFRFCT